ncbi:MAG TPA: FtsX-like permease family protein [Acidobacteriaceae bacterium]|nr:FtsX-like permease family protein [Acidobacteriaceae bacterium]
MDLDKKPSLTWSSAAKIAWREVHASRAKFLFVMISVAIGVAALTGVRGFSDSFQKTLLGEARTIMAADLSARMFRQPTAQEEQQLNAMASHGIQRTQVTEMVSMVSSPGDPVPLLVSLKAVDPQRYPFYGAVQLEPAGDLRQVLTDSTVVVAEDLLIRLRTRVGASLKIGNSTFRIAAVVAHEPDRMSSGMGLGPRVMMTQNALEKSGLLQQGSRSGERFLFKLAGNKSNVAAERARLEQVLPDAQVTDFRESNPALTDGLKRSTGLLSLICLVAMVLGAIGVAMAMRAHLQQRIDVLAIMKSIGARSSDILRIYLFQTVMLGLAGGLIGVTMGLGVEWVFPSLLGKFLPIHLDLRLPWRSALAGLATGILTTVLFCLPPLLQIRKVRPNLVLRRMVEEPQVRRSWWVRLAESRAQWITAVIILFGLGAIAAALSDSVVVGRWFAGALSALLVVILAVSALTLRVVRAFLSRTRLHLQSAVRHGLANLYRPGNQSAAVLAALGMGVMLILTVFLMQHDVIGEMRMTSGPNLPNVFLVDISSRELEGVKHLMSQQPAVHGDLETLPVVAGRIVSVDGTEEAGLKLKNYPRRLLQTVSMTWSTDLPEGARMVHGSWWDRDDGQSMAVTEHIAQRLNLHLGSQIVFYSNGRTIHATIVAVIRHNGQHVYGRSEFILTPRALTGLPVVWYGAAHVDPKEVGAVQRALFNAYPTVTVINIADVIETVQSVVQQITIVVRFLAAFSILAGAVILASSIASTQFRRIREVVVLKTLGAKRNHIAAVFSVEFIVLGLLAGVVGVIFANLLSRVLLHRLDVAFHIEWLATAIALVGTAILATVTGWVASFRILGQKPLQVLREE